MVTTRSGPKLGKFVRFRKGVSVRRILNFDNTNFWDDSSSEDSQPEVNGYGSTKLLSSKLSSSEDTIQDTSHASNKATGCTDKIASDEECSSSPFSSVRCTSILYDEISQPCWGSVIWDTMVFLTVVVLMYTATFFINKFFSYTILVSFGAIGIVLFLYNVTYFDSARPGVSPPTPLSPAKYRLQSGHTFHLNYATPLLYGLIFLVIHLSYLGYRTTPV